MKKVILVAVLAAVFSGQAQAAVLCQSMRDPNFQAWFEGYSCPTGFFMIDVR